jgi:ABC-2 type transport system ATP-binding protein
MIEARQLRKRYGDKVAVDGVSFVVEPGRVTGFLGPNGAGKSTTMRMIVGLDRPTGGEVTVNGKTYRSHAAPLREVGALLEAKAAHSGRSARSHLRALAQTHGIGRARVNEVVDLVGLRDVAGKRAGAFSLGMGQRLGIAAALLGDPSTLILDEPVNGLDPDGVLWVRKLLQRLAAEGRTVFVSSHLMSEMALVANHLIVIGRGKILADSDIGDFIDQAAEAQVRVRSPELARLQSILASAGANAAITDGAMDVAGLSIEAIGEAAATNNIVLHELTSRKASLEDAFMKLTGDSLDFRSVVAGEASPRPTDIAPPAPNGGSGEVRQ